FPLCPIGFARSFGLVLPGGQRREWVKPIMFSGGIGAIEDGHVHKETPQPGMLVVKIGGPAYRIGVGGGAASSIQVQGDNSEERDIGGRSTRGPRNGQKLNRVLRGCVEYGAKNPICSIHDQGAGGNGNVLKEICDPAGAVIYASRFQRGDPTLSVLELWGAEYQESNALLARPQGMELLEALGRRERCPISVVGSITGDGKVVLVDDLDAPVQEGGSHEGLPTPVNLKLEWVLGGMPRKEFRLHSSPPHLIPLSLPPGLKVAAALERILKLPAVGSKRYLTNKVDRSVTGLVAQQQCVGPLDTPLADVAVVALSHYELMGSATSIGEQPIKGLLDPAAGARLALCEAITNLCFARVTDIKNPIGSLLWVALNPGQHRLGGSALAQVYSQIGDSCPDLDDPKTLVAAFRVTQELLQDRLLMSGHDVSDGGLLTCVLEMAFAANCGISIDFSTTGMDSDPLSLLFSEEPGLVLEVKEDDAAAILERYHSQGVSCRHIGTSGSIGPHAEVGGHIGSL
ncbi:phosphoribosylformylglycinamidine synthase, partial [Coturnix japonica]|uniref:phosphoribosylformylglycinamidine synthase n=1 Tax=Coturnix japonica TaxID=93934 RepID=UPI0013A5DFF8